MAQFKVTYPDLDGSLYTFNIPFPFLETTDISLEYVQIASDDTEIVTPIDESLFEVSGSTLTYTGTPGPVGTIRIERTTNVDALTNLNQKGSALSAEAENRKDLQLLYALQERDRFSGSGSSPEGFDPVVLQDYVSGLIDVYSATVDAGLLAIETAQNDLQTELDATEATLEETRANLATLGAQEDARYSSTSTITTDLASNFTQLQTSVNTELTSMDAYIRQLELTTAEGNASLVTQLGVSLGEVENEVLLLQTATTTNASDITALTSRTTTAESSITTINSTLASQASSITALETSVAGANTTAATSLTTSQTTAASLVTLSSRTDDVEGRIDNLDNVTNGIATSVDSLETSTGEITARVVTLEQTSTSGLATRVTTLESVVDENSSSILDAQSAADDNATELTELRTEYNGTVSAVTTLQSTSSSLVTSYDALSLQSASLSGQVTSTAAIATDARNKINATWGLSVDANGVVGGIRLSSNGSVSDLVIDASTFQIRNPNNSNIVPFAVDTVSGVITMTNVEVDTIKAGTVITDSLADGAVTSAVIRRGSPGSGIINSATGFSDVVSVFLNVVAGGFVRVSYSIQVATQDAQDVRYDVEVSTPAGTRYQYDIAVGNFSKTLTNMMIFENLPVGVQEVKVRIRTNGGRTRYSVGPTSILQNYDVSVEQVKK